MALLVALLALLGERESRKIPDMMREVVAKSLKVPKRAISVEVGMGERAISKILVRTEGGVIPLELLKKLRPTGRRPSFPVKVGEFLWEARGIGWGKLKVTMLSVRLRGAELDGARLLKGELRVGRLGRGELELLLSPADLVRALVEAGVSVSRVEFSEGAMSFWLGPRGMATFYVKVRPQVSRGKIGFLVVEARAGLVPIPRGVAQVALDRALSKFSGTFSLFGSVSGLEVKVSPEGFLIRGELGGPVRRGLEGKRGRVIQ